MWTTPEAKATKDWQKQLGEKLANHLTTCGFQSHLQGDKLHFYPSIHLQKPIIYLTQSYSEGCSCQLKRVVFPIAVWSLQVKAKLNRLILDLRTCQRVPEVLTIGAGSFCIRVCGVAALRNTSTF